MEDTMSKTEAFQVAFDKFKEAHKSILDLDRKKLMAAKVAGQALIEMRHVEDCTVEQLLATLDGLGTHISQDTHNRYVKVASRWDELVAIAEQRQIDLKALGYMEALDLLPVSEHAQKVMAGKQRAKITTMEPGSAPQKPPADWTGRVISFNGDQTAHASTPEDLDNDDEEEEYTCNDGKAYAHRQAMEGLDYYPTPPSLVWELMKTDEMQGRRDFYEPACGKDRAISNELVKARFAVTATDIIHGDDFLLSKEWHETIITNPPFSLFDEFVRKAKTSCSLFAFIAKTNYFGAYQRHQEGIWQHLRKVYIFNRQVDYRSPIRDDGVFQCGNLITGWFIWDMTWKERYWLMEIMDVQPYAQGHHTT
jgi:hypothetical protein